MKMTRAFLPLLFAVTLIAPLGQTHAANTDGTVTYNVTTINYNGGYDPKHVAVVWLVDSDGKFVKTLCRHAGTRIGYLYKWIADRGSYTAVDGVTSATLSTQPQTHTVRWNCRGTNGLISADGTYTFRAEYTSSNAQGPYMAANCAFVKGSVPVTTNYANFSNASGQFTSMSLTYTPYNEVVISGLTPNSGTVNANVAVVVTLTNQTYNTLSFSVAVSNLTSGTLIGTQPVNALAGRASTNLVVNWNTAGLTPAAYQVRAVAAALATETNTSDNVYTASIDLSSLTAGDLAVSALSPVEGVAGLTLPLRLTVTNKTSDATGPFQATLSNLTGVARMVGTSSSWRIAASVDDAEENLTTHSVSLTSTDLELTVDTANQMIGLRFRNVTIPRDATVTSAYVQFTDKTGEDLNTTPITLTVTGQNADNAAVFTTAASNLSARGDTAAAVTWSPPLWADGASGSAQRTPDLSAILQEIVARPGWSVGNALALKLTGTGTGSRRAWSYDGNTAGAALLVAEWTVPSPLIGVQTVNNLSALAATNLVFVWETSAVTAGVFQIRAQAGPLASETFLADNAHTTPVTLRAPLHDVAVEALRVPAMIPPNIVTNVVVAVTNRGDLAETFTNTLRDVTASPLVIGTRVLTNLAAGAGASLTFPWNTGTNATFALGYHTLAAEASRVPGEVALENNTHAVQTLVSFGFTTNAHAAAGAVWRYLDQGLDLGKAPWTSAGYYDGFWAAGPTPLGFVLTNISTTIGYGVSTNRHIATYFRREFTLDFLPTAVTARLMRADGAIVYLNGKEVARHNLPAGEITAGTLALSAVTGLNAVTYYDVPLDIGDLIIGRNLLAAELHLSSRVREAAGFSLELQTVNATLPVSRSLAATGLAPDGPAQSGDAVGVTVSLANTGNVTASGLLLIRDAATGAVLGSQAVGPLVPGEAVGVRVTLSTFGAATGSRTLEAVTVIGGVTNTTAIAIAPFLLSAPDFAPRPVSATGSIGGRCNAVAVSGSRVYLGCGATLEVWDVSTPSVPTRIGMLRLPDVVQDLASDGSWIYAATGAAGVQIVDASSASQLAHRATYDTSGFARRLALAGNTLYIADVLGGVRALDVTAPASPTLAGVYQTTGPAQALACLPSRLLVADGQRGVQNLQAATPSSLALAGAYRDVSAGVALAAGDGKALVTDANGGLFAISTLTPTNLTLVASRLLPATGQGLATAGSAVYVAAGPAGLLTLNGATLETVSAQDTGGDASDATVLGTTLYVAAGFGGALSFDISSPLSPRPLAVFPTAARGSDASATGSTLYVAANEAGLQLHRLENLSLPTLIGALPSAENPRCVTVTSPHLLVGCGLADLKIFSISDPAAPTLLGSYTASGLSHIRRIAATRQRAALTDGHTIHLVSLSNPAAPLLLATHTPGGFVFDLAAVDGEVYAACGGYGLKALRMDALTEDATLVTPGPATGVDVASNRLTVACGPAGWQTLNIDNPANPVLVKTIAGRAVFATAVAGDLVYLADGERTALVANVSAPLTPVDSAAFANLTLALRVRAVGGLLLTAEDEAGLALFNASPGDINLNGVEDAWEQQIVDASVATNGPVRSVLDVDLRTVGPNKYTYYQSYLAGLTPTDPNSVLALSAVKPTPDSGGQITVRWRSVPGKRYTLYKSTDLAAGFTALPGATGIIASASESSYVDTVTTPRAFYLVAVTP